ncbi:MAG: hypothetical protein V7L01_01975 [Nostoc sp.]
MNVTRNMEENIGIFGVAYLRDDFASFVGWASCPSLVFQGARVAHPTRIIP